MLRILRGGGIFFMVGFSVVVPAFNEAGCIARNMRALAAACERTGRVWEIVLCVEHSTDSTLEQALEVARELEQLRVLDLPVQRGKGAAVREGFLQAQGEIVFMCDADLSADLGAIDTFLKLFDADAQVAGVVGRRRSRVGKSPFLRRFLSGVFHAWVKRLTGLPFSDTQCGFKAFKKPFARELAQMQTETGYVFDIEWLLYAQQKNWRVQEADVLWKDDPDTRVRLPRDGIRMLKSLRRLRGAFKK